MPTHNEVFRREHRIRRRLRAVAVTLTGAGALVGLTLPWMLDDWSLLNAGLLLLVLGTVVYVFGEIRFHGRSIDEAYRLGYDLGYEIGWRAKELENDHNGDERPLAPRRR